MFRGCWRTMLSDDPVSEVKLHRGEKQFTFKMKKPDWIWKSEMYFEINSILNRRWGQLVKQRGQALHCRVRRKLAPRCHFSHPHLGGMLCYTVALFYHVPNCVEPSRGKYQTVLYHCIGSDQGMLCKTERGTLGCTRLYVSVPLGDAVQQFHSAYSRNCNTTFL